MGLFGKQKDDILSKKDIARLENEQETLKKRCVDALETYRNKKNGIQNTLRITAECLIEADPFKKVNYYIWIADNYIWFFPNFSFHPYTRDDSEKMEQANIIKYQLTNVQISEQKADISSAVNKEYKLMVDYLIVPIILNLQVKTAEGIFDMVFKVENRQYNIDTLNQLFPHLQIKNCCNLFNMPLNRACLRISGNSSLVDKRVFFAWKQDDNLLMTTDVSNVYCMKDTISFITIPLHSIEYYRIEGDISYENKISGGGGGGVNVDGAIVGGLLFGAAGAIIGSRERIEGISSERIVHDKRHTTLSLLLDGRRQQINFDVAAFDELNKVIPEKSFDYLMIDRARLSGKEEKKEFTLPEQIMQLAQLKEQGILTEEEFSEAKKILLNKLKT